MNEFSKILDTFQISDEYNTPSETLLGYAIESAAERVMMYEIKVPYNVREKLPIQIGPENEKLHTYEIYALEGKK